jgi:hypothetical protein
MIRTLRWLALALAVAFIAWCIATGPHSAFQRIDWA